MKQVSYFDGGMIDYVFYSLLAGLITALTAGIGTPWAIVILLKWKVSHTVIEGRRLYFSGNALDLFVQWLKWFLLIIITFGIYSFWVAIKLEQWKVKHTHFVDEQELL
ncbi:DUF898 family protein [Streptococcus zalophi]|uniref:DUF898 family protein n=1 Tax=Streptococcus zalophi TaxID=640031 RepID=A0A934PB42_9STRE|nr:DUF898 family protein [Streptococcus zalophi]MBJ8350243.1 DUF898 family protein [Streptococcus zalophi]